MKLCYQEQLNLIICLENLLKMSWRYLEDVLKTFSQDVLKTSWKRIEDVLKMYDQDEYIGINEDVLKTSSEDEDQRRLHQDECLLGLMQFNCFFQSNTFAYLAY